MKPIDPAEISALVDGELPADRAEEVRRAIAADPSLRRAYSELSAMDADLKHSAAQAMFQPCVVLPQTESSFGFRMFLGATGLVLARVVMKLASPELAAVLATILLAVVIGAVLWLLTACSTLAAPATRGAE